MPNDIEFLVNEGDNKGRYRYTLALIEGAKAWNRQPLFIPAPSMRKEKIDMTIEVREKNITVSGQVEEKDVSKILEELENIAGETEPAILIGIDGIERLVQIDQNGFSVTSTVKEMTREPEYRVSLTCWVLYNYGNKLTTH